MKTTFYFNFDFHVFKQQRHINNLPMNSLHVSFKKSSSGILALLIKSRLHCVDIKADHCNKSWALEKPDL